MSEIPADIKITAIAIAESWGRMDWNAYEGNLSTDLSDEIANALLKERQRCAKIAEEIGQDWVYPEWYKQCCSIVSQAILSDKEES